VLLGCAIDDFTGAERVFDVGQRSEIYGRVLMQNGQIGLKTSGDAA
jgi:hypothetical protein